MSSNPATSKFESAVLEQLDAANNLARWLVRNDQDAQDVVQESCIKALRAFDSFRGGDFRAWFLTIVRNTSFTWLRRRNVSQSPTRAECISLTIKSCGDFTTLIDRIRVGDRASVHGPFGRFSCDFHPNEGHLVFIAGGVGITPLMSMLRAMRDRGESRRVTLIYANRELDDIAFATELFTMERGQHPALKVVHVLSQPPSWWAGETGRIDASRLDEWCEGLEDKAFYLCCPSQMNVELVRALRKYRVSPSRIHCDYFSL